MLVVLSAQDVGERVHTRKHTHIGTIIYCRVPEGKAIGFVQFDSRQVPLSAHPCAEAPCHVSGLGMLAHRVLCWLQAKVAKVSIDRLTGHSFPCMLLEMRVFPCGWMYLVQAAEQAMQTMNNTFLMGGLSPSFPFFLPRPRMPVLASVPPHFVHIIQSLCWLTEECSGQARSGSIGARLALVKALGPSVRLS